MHVQVLANNMAAALRLFIGFFRKVTPLCVITLCPGVTVNDCQTKGMFSWSRLVGTRLELGYFDVLK